jgi:MoxR-like ATPase
MVDFSKDYRATQQVADIPLRNDGFGALVARAKQGADDRGLVLPDPDLLDRAVAALLTGHLILEGPPGTGKTTLAEVLAEAFEVSTHMTTATADWSTYDVIGGFQPSGSDEATVEVLKPWLGEVTRAALQCATTVAQFEDPADHDQDKQAHWLIVDEINRGDIDKAFGPLYTALGGSGGDSRKLPLWFGGDDEFHEIWLIDRFRIIGTLNSVDTAYVFTLSQGLQRRFSFVYVGVPREEQVQEEVDAAANHAASWHAAVYGGTSAEAITGGAALTLAKTRTAAFVKAVRYPAEEAGGGWPVGSAQVHDVLKNVVLRVATIPDDQAAGLRAVDLSLADKVVPQMSGLTRKQLEAFEMALSTDELKDLERTSRALQRIRSSQHTAFA